MRASDFAARSLPKTSAMDKTKVTSMTRLFLMGLFLCTSALGEEMGAPLPQLANDALTQLNVRRTKIGLPPLIRNALLDRSAAAHADYLAHNLSLSAEGHSEQLGKPGYTGATPAMRIAATGYPRASTSENIALTSYPLGALSTDNLIDAPYHRQAQLGPYLEAGVAMTTQPAPAHSVNARQYIYVINFGGDDVSHRLATPQTYPVDGQVDVPIDWIANESPNPLPDMAGKRVGYPLSLSAAPGDSLQLKSFSLSDAGNNVVTGRLVTTHTDDHRPTESYALWIPLAPLSYDTQYIAHATGTLNDKLFDVRWHFITRSYMPLQLEASSAQLLAGNGSITTIKLHGGTNSNLSVTYAGQRFQYMGKLPPQISFVTASHIAPDTLVLTRNDTPCAHTVSACEIIVKGKDSTGTEILLVLPVK